jgi:hypothetical protein
MTTISYWCKFFDAGGRVIGGEKMEAPDDAGAIAKARVIFVAGIGNSYEIWDGIRLVHRSGMLSH